MHVIWNKFSRCYSPWIEVFPLAMVVLTIAYAISSYPGLPETIPMRFDVYGAPSQLNSKGSIMVWPALSLWLYLQNLLINYFLVISPDKPSTGAVSFLLRPKDAEEKMEAIRRPVARALWTINLLLGTLFFYILQRTISVAQGQETHLGLTLWLVVGMIIAVATYVVISGHMATKASPQE